MKLLRQALEDLIAADALTPPLSASYRYQYLAALDPLAMPQVLIAQRNRERELAGRAPENFLGYLPALEAYLAGEPERSRRVLNLLVANDLAWCDRLPADRPAFAVPALRIYDPDPRAPTVNGAIRPSELARLVGSSLIAPALSWRLDELEKFAGIDRWSMNQLIEPVAVALFTRETGRAPTSPAEAVNHYRPDPDNPPDRDESKPIR